MAKEKVKTVKVDAKSTKGWLTRPVYQKSMEQVIESHAKDGWALFSTVPINDRKGKTTHYLLTFKK
jgi:hypothetical protein